MLTFDDTYFMREALKEAERYQYRDKENITKILTECYQAASTFIRVIESIESALMSGELKIHDNK